jgi:hypothetical protein
MFASYASVMPVRRLIQFSAAALVPSPYLNCAFDSGATPF